jgi:hypothetical protein
MNLLQEFPLESQRFFEIQKLFAFRREIPITNFRKNEV